MTRCNVPKKCQCYSQSVGHRTRWDDTVFIECHSQTGGHRTTYHEAIFHKKEQCYSLSIEHIHSDRCEEAAFKQMYTSVTHSLLVIGQAIMRLPFRKHFVMSLTIYWS